MPEHLSPKPETPAAEADWPRFSDIPEPRMVALYTGNGSGTKLFQGFLDGHPEIYMVPAYPLMYLYPHWTQWREELAGNWSWTAIIDAFCIQHASVIDTREIPGYDGMSRLGDDRQGYIAINERQFKDFLLHLLQDEPMEARTFLLALHYAYAFCRAEDMTSKKVLVFHIHVHEYVRDYLFRDFPDMLVLATVRDPRSNLFGRYNSSEANIDEQRYDATDAAIFRRRVYFFIMRYFFETMQILDGFPAERARVVRHEALFYDLPGVMRRTAEFLGIDDDPVMLDITFGGMSWWSDPIYKTGPTNKVNPRIVSLDWQKKIGQRDWYVFEGLFSDYMEKYGYKPLKIERFGLFERMRLLAVIFLPSNVECDEFIAYLRPARIAAYFRNARDEATGRIALKDYTFNAFYRHKWTQRDLNIWRPRWYRQWLVRALSELRETPGNDAAKLRLRAAQGTYLGVSLIRYIWAILSFPIYVGRRYGVTLPAYWRVLRHRNVLPDSLE